MFEWLLGKKSHSAFNTTRKPQSSISNGNMNNMSDISSDDVERDPYPVSTSRHKSAPNRKRFSPLARHRRSQRSKDHGDRNSGDENQGVIVETCDKRRRNKIPNRVYTGRLLFITCLMAVTVSLGYSAHYFLTDAEEDLGVHQFGSLAERALTSARAVTERRLMGGISMGAIAAGMNPSVEQWPNITFGNFEEIALDVKQTSDGRGLGIAVIVKPEQVAGFEAFAKETFERSDEWPEGIGHSPFGFGIFNIDVSAQTWLDVVVRRSICFPNVNRPPFCPP